MKCTRCGESPAVADGLCGPCHVLRFILEARDRNAVPDYKTRQANDA